MCSVLELAGSNLYREHSSILAPMKGFECDRLSARYSFSDARDRCFVQAGIEIARKHSDHLFATVTQAFTRLPVHVEE